MEWGRQQENGAHNGKQKQTALAVFQLSLFSFSVREMERDDTTKREKRDALATQRVPMTHNERTPC